MASSARSLAVCRLLTAATLLYLRRLPATWDPHSARMSARSFRLAFRAWCNTPLKRLMVELDGTLGCRLPLSACF